MQIGTVTIDPIIDGEITGPAEFFYPGQTFSDPGPSECYDHLTGDMIATVGAYLIRTPSRVVLVDAGNGPRPKVPPFRGGALRGALLSYGVHPDDVTDVLFTHLHYDHIGWASVDGVPYFRNATFRCDRRDWDHFTAPDYDMTWEGRASNPETDTPRVRLGPVRDRMEFWEGDDEIFEGMSAMDAAGHSPGNSVLVVESDGERGVLLGDAAHTIPELLEGADFRVNDDAEQAARSLARIRDFVVDNGLPCSGSHFAGLIWGRVHRDGDRYHWETIGRTAAGA